MRRKWGWVSSAVAVMLIASGVCGCGVRKAALPVGCPEAGCPPQVTSTFLVEDGYPRDIDVLFVVDDTAALASSAEALAAGYRKAATILAPQPAAPERAPSVRVLFVSGSHRPDTGPASSPRAAACGIAAPEEALGTDKCGRAPNTTRPFEDSFACLAALGNESTGAFEPFAALKRVFSGSGPVGFLRANAYLQVVIVAGQDDASSLDVADSVAFLKSLKAYPDRVLLSVVGPPTAPRLLALAEAFGPSGLYATARTEDAIPIAIERGYTATGRFVEPACIPRVFDTEPSVAGLQPDCAVTARQWGSERRYDRALPRCDQGAPPCWTLSPSSVCGPDGLLFHVDRGPDGCAQDGLTESITCRSCDGASDPACGSY